MIVAVTVVLAAVDGFLGLSRKKKPPNALISCSEKRNLIAFVKPNSTRHIYIDYVGYIDL